METTEIIAELRRLLEVGDSPVFCGGTFISKQLAKEAADRLESLDKRWKRTVVERDQARAMRGRAERLLAEKTSGDLISRSAVLAALSRKLSIVDMIGVAGIVESVPAVEAHDAGDLSDLLDGVEFCDFESGQYFRTSVVTTESTGTVVMLERID